MGPWQFMPETAKEYGLKVGGPKDDRTDLAKATEAAADYFTGLLRMFGTERYLLAVASYNTGQNRVKRFQIASTVNKEKSSDFWHIRSRLPNETAEYVPKFMAAVIIGRNPERWDVAH
jgi:membrane-bound lytic murein transglycosylase D